MCSNYVPVTRSDRMLKFFGVNRDPKGDEMPVDTWPSGLGPFIRLAEPGSGNKLMVDDGRFGLVAPGRMEMVKGQRALRIDRRGFHNARAETVHQLRSFKTSWEEGRRCVVPIEAFYEFYFEEGKKPVRWRIQQPHDIPLGVAGIYRWSTFEDGTEGWSFAMLTVNADGHPVMSRFHGPGEEKRMVVILDPKEYGPWLQCSVQEAPRYFRLWQGQLESFPAPLAQRGAKPKILPPPQDPGLF